VELVLPGSDGLEHAPLQAGNKNAVVLFFVSPYCPTANTFMSEIKAIVTEYRDDFVFQLIHAEPGLEITQVLEHQERFEFPLTALLDLELKLARRVGARITPEAVVCSPAGTPLYRGRINDLYLGPTKRQRQATTRDLRDALEALRTGKAMPQPQAAAVGCKISGLD
jgi:hypothetical protein